MQFKLFVRRLAGAAPCNDWSRLGGYIAGFYSMQLMKRLIWPLPPHHLHQGYRYLQAQPGISHQDRGRVASSAAGQSHLNSETDLALQQPKTCPALAAWASVGLNQEKGGNNDTKINISKCYEPIFYSYVCASNSDAKSSLLFGFWTACLKLCSPAIYL